MGLVWYEFVQISVMQGSETDWHYMTGTALMPGIS